jgi:hypothetical protein
MQSGNLKPKGIKFLARSYLAAGLFILLVNLSPILISNIRGFDEVLQEMQEMPVVSVVPEVLHKMTVSASDKNTQTDGNPASASDVYKANTGISAWDKDISNLLKLLSPFILIGIGFTYIIFGIALSSAKSWSIKIFSSMTIIFAVLAVFASDLSLYVYETILGSYASMLILGPIYLIFDKFILVGAVLFPVIVDRYLHSSNIEAYFNSKVVTPNVAPTSVAGYTHRSPF